ncbi:MAG: hypothetical protein ACRD29_00710 [Acidimicrobiales bacterium]
MGSIDVAPILRRISVVVAMMIAASAHGVASARADSQAVAAIYAADFVSTAADGEAMNDAGDVAGSSYPDPGCGPFCLPPLETIVWRGGERIVLPSVPGLTGTTVRGINDDAWVAGFAGDVGITSHAVVWRPTESGYVAIDLGTLPGTTISEAIGIDDFGRVVGWSTTSSFPPQGSPFMWSEATGMVDLGALGFPLEIPLAMSPGGTVATADSWYRLVDPGSVVAMPPPPDGFAIGTFPTAINDAGDQGRFLVALVADRPLYLFRFHHEGTWQQISSTAILNSLYDMGSITAAKDITATERGVGVVAPGPDGLAEPFVGLLSPAYKDRVITVGGPMNESGEILAEIMVGRSTRLMRMVPATDCATSCIEVAALQMRSRFVEDPSDPGSCTPDGEAYNLSRVKVTVTSETGAPLSGVLVEGRFLDDYWTSTPVSRRTNSEGVASFRTQGPCGVGAVAFLVESARKRALVFDRTEGVLTNWVIPQ